MSNIREDTLSVIELKREVNASIEKIKRRGLIQTRNGCDYLADAKRLLNEAEYFLKTIEKTEFSSCKNIFELRLKLQIVANNLKKELIKAQNLFIHPSKGEYWQHVLKNANEEKIVALKLEIQWLEKCIQIARNRKYFEY